MKLEKLQRHFFYVIMAQELKELSKREFVDGFCDIFYEITGEWPLNRERVFPELYAKKTTIGAKQMWFNNWEERKRVIIKCIKETA